MSDPCVLDTASNQISLVSGRLGVNTRVSALPSQTLSIQADGLYVPQSLGVPSPDAGNLVGLRTNGLYAQSLWGGWEAVVASTPHTVTLPAGGTDVSPNAQLIIGPLPFPMNFLAIATFGDMQYLPLGGTPAGLIESTINFASGWASGGGSYNNQVNTNISASTSAGFTPPPMARHAFAGGGSTVTVQAFHVLHSTTSGQTGTIVHPAITLSLLAWITP